MFGRKAPRLRRPPPQHPDLSQNRPLPSVWAKSGLVEVGDVLEGEGAPMPKPPKRPKAPPKPLPAELVPFPNLDKTWHESWEVKEGDPPRDLLNFPHPYRAVLCGPPNRGKTTAVKNILVRQWPPFERFVLIYPGGQQGTAEYNDVLGDEIEILDKVPPTSWWPTVTQGAKKTLVSPTACSIPA